MEDFFFNYFVETQTGRIIAKVVGYTASAYMIFIAIRFIYRGLKK